MWTLTSYVSLRTCNSAHGLWCTWRWKRNLLLMQIILVWVPRDGCKMKMKKPSVCASLHLISYLWFEVVTYHQDLFIAAVSAGAAITRIFWPAVTMKVQSFYGTDSQASGPKSIRWATGGSMSVRYQSNWRFLKSEFHLLSVQEHEKRCWSVDFNLMDPKLLASGSDDAKGNWAVPLNPPPVWGWELRGDWRFHFIQIQTGRFDWSQLIEKQMEW